MEKELTLRDLQIGDKFISASQKDKGNNATRYEVLGSPYVVSGFVSVRSCKNETTGWPENKSCSIKVIKLPIHAKDENKEKGD